MRAHFRDALFLLLGMGLILVLQLWLHSRDQEQRNANLASLLKSISRTEYSVALLHKSSCDLAQRENWPSEAVAHALLSAQDSLYSTVTLSQISTIKPEIISSFEAFENAVKHSREWRNRTVARTFAKQDTITRNHALLTYSGVLDVLIQRSLELTNTLNKYYPSN
jgi:hypothetical protein